MFNPEKPESWGRERPNKSQLKREAQAMLELGEKLARHSSRWDQWNLPEELRSALAEYNAIRSFGAKKRQLKKVGKILRHLDTEALEQAIAAIEHAHRLETAEHHEAERWRERLLADADALTEFIATHPACDVPRIRLLIRQSKKERKEQPPRCQRELFRLIREHLRR